MLTIMDHAQNIMHIKSCTRLADASPIWVIAARLYGLTAELTGADHGHQYVTSCFQTHLPF